MKDMRRFLICFLGLGMVCELCTGRFLFKAIDTSGGLSDNQIRYISQLPDGRMVFMTAQCLNLYDGLHFTSFRPSPSAAIALTRYDGFHRMYQQGDSLLWIKNNRKLVCFNLYNEQYEENVYRRFRGISDPKSVDDLFVDGRGRLWLSTSGELVLLQSSLRFKLADMPGKLQDVSADNDFLYTFFDTGDISCYCLANGRHLYTRSAYSEAERAKFGNTSLVVRKDNEFYQLRNGSRGGFFCFDIRKREWKKLMEESYTLNTLSLSAGNEAYISCARGLWSIDLSRGEKRYFPTLRTQQGNVMATEISTVFQDGQGALWLGTFNRGLLYEHPVQYEQMRIDGWHFPFPSEPIKEDTHFAEDRSGNVFLKEKERSYRIEISDSGAPRLLPVEARHIPSEVLEYGSGAAFAAHDGTLYFGETNGCSIFRPRLDRASVTLPYAPLLTAFYVRGEAIEPQRKYDERKILERAVPYTRHISLNHNQNFISFDFSALNYLTGMPTLYRYQLEGIDEQWVYGSTAPQANGTFRIPYTNLPTGSYTLHVMTATDGNGWDTGRSAQIELVIHAPWWKTTAAYAVYMFLLTAGVIIGIRIYIHYSRKEMERRHKEEILLLRIRNLIEQCNRYEAELNAPAEEAEPETGLQQTNAADDAFLKQAIELVEKNLNVSGYSVEQLSKDLCMERTGLYKKLVAMLDQSPSLFIRNIRLQKAAQLILENELSISEIAERTGFSSSSYLSKCFQKVYGCRPSEYMSKRQKST